MSQLNSFPPFSFSPTPGFTFCAGPSSTNARSSVGSKPSKPRLPPSLHRSRKSPPASSQRPPAAPETEKGAEGSNSMKARNFEEVPETETTKTKLTTPSAVTGVIPCHFEGSTYFSNLQSSTFCSAEEPTRKEMHDKSESSSPSTQIVPISRILKGIPQNPHFLPLKAYSNVTKQRLIKAWDNIFKETVNKLLSIQVPGFSADSKGLWETMKELQSMGYNVLPLRIRLVELTDVLIKQRKHKREITRLKNAAEQHRMEKSRLELEIVNLRAKVEAEKANVEDMIAKIAKMEDETPFFDVVFTCQAIQMF